MAAPGLDLDNLQLDAGAFFHLPDDFGLDFQAQFPRLSLPPLDQPTDDNLNGMAILRFDDSEERWVSPTLLDYSAVPSEVAKSPSWGSLHTGTESSLLLSPSAHSQHILTPGSTALDSPCVAGLEDPESDTNPSTSPEREHSPTRDYVLVNQPSRNTRRGNRGMNDSCTRASPTLLNATQAAVPPPTTAHHSSAPPSFNPSSSALIGDFAALPTTQYTYYPGSDFPLFGDLTANAGSGFDLNTANVTSFPTLPFRPNHLGSIPSHSPFEPQYTQNGDFSLSNDPAYQSQGYSPHFDVACTSFVMPGAQQYGSDADFHNFFNATRPGNASAQGLAYSHAHPSAQTPSTSTPSSGSKATNTQAVATPRTTHHRPRPRINVTSSDAGYSPQSSQSSASFDGNNTSQGVMYAAIRQADPSIRIPTVSQRTAQHEHKVQKGGRKKGIHLPEQSRARSHQMRKLGACWRCAMQRDPCDHGDPCSRCAMRSQRGQTYYFGCDRSKLPDFVTEFLPPSLCLDYTKQILEDVVAREVVHWHPKSAIDVYLSSGYGPPLRWKLVEFTPNSTRLLWQLQYYQNPHTGRSESRQKYSPPYGLLKLDSADDGHFERYLNDLLLPFYLKHLGSSCYAEENEVDPDRFQSRVLDMMSHLYIRTQDEKVCTAPSLPFSCHRANHFEQLKNLLQDILRMMVITWIMGHTLTITEDTLHPVINNVRHSQRPEDSQLQGHTSPRLANRQLKFFFNVMRNQIYEKVLKWLQQTLHTAGKKEQTWLQSFCVLLGFAMVLEEIQRTMQCAADASIVRGEATIEEATAQACRGCKGIDDRFKLLVGLFQCKYRDKKWGDRGSFGNGTPELKEPIAQEFCATLRSMVEYKQDHLRRRESVSFSLDNQCLYTTRLTAKFLLPFLDITNTS